jgi:PST family polysaccharide transporter
VKNLVQSLLKAGIGQAVTIVLSAIAVKLLAITAGPTGVGVFSLVRQLQQTLTMVASLGGQNAVVQGMASEESIYVRHGYRYAAFWSMLVFCVLVISVVFLFADNVASFFLPTLSVNIVYWLMAAVVMGVGVIFFRGLLNARLSISGVAWVNVSSAFAAVMLAYPAGIAYMEGNANALAFILVGSLGLGLIVAIMLSISSGALTGFLTTSFKFPDIKVFYKFLFVAFPSLLTGLLGLGSILLVRVLIAKHHGVSAAGYFDAAWSISVMYMSLFFSSLQTYLLPTISAGRLGSSLYAELGNALRLSFIVLLPIITLLIVIKPLVVHILFSGEFIEGLDVLRWTLLGDYLRIAAWVLALFLLARAEMKAYLFHEFLWNLVFISLSVWLIPIGIQWVGVAYLIAYLAYFLSLLCRATSHYKIKIPVAIFSSWVKGLSIVVFATVLTWSDRDVVWWKVSLFFFAVLFAWSLVNDNEKIYVKRLFSLGEGN